LGIPEALEAIFNGIKPTNHGFEGHWDGTSQLSSNGPNGKNNIACIIWNRNGL